MLKPFFSIIIPSYNSAKTIRKCVASVLNQTYQNFEVVVIDNQSTDDTINILKLFDDKRILIISEKDKGIYDAMNKGIDAATGEYLYFLGSDDSLYDHTVLEKIAEMVEQTKSKFIYGNIFTSDQSIQKYENFTFKKLINLNICHQAIFYHHSLFKNLRYDLKFKICADWDVNLKTFKQKNHPLYLDMIVANYNLQGISGDWRQHPDYLNYFKNLSFVIRYRGRLYYLYLLGMLKLKNLKHKISKLKP